MALKSTSPLAGLLRKSPFKPIQEHMRKVFSCVCLLPPLLDALYRNDQTQVAEFAAQIGVIETEADKMKSDFRLHMPKTLFLPVDPSPRPGCHCRYNGKHQSDFDQQGHGRSRGD